MVSIRHIDVLALMIIQLRHSSSSIEISNIFYIRNWLLNASFVYVPFRRRKKLMLNLIEEKVDELGFMTGFAGIDKNKTDIEATRDSFIAALLSGKSVKLDHLIDFFD